MNKLVTDKYSTEIVLQGYNSTLTMLVDLIKQYIKFISKKIMILIKTNQQNNSDLDDEIPF